jgi:hypothetical protein
MLKVKNSDSVLLALLACQGNKDIVCRFIIEVLRGPLYVKWFHLSEFTRCSEQGPVKK